MKKRYGFLDPPEPPNFEDAIDAMIYWVKEREAIRIKKESGAPRPWTSDQILGTYRFCNARREDDRVTRWIAANIRKPFANHPALWFMLCIGRWVNWPDTLKELIVSREAWPSSRHFTCEALGRVLEQRLARGKKTFGAAYKIPALGKAGSKGKKVAEDVLQPLWRDGVRFDRHLTRNPTLQSTHELLTEYEGFGDFMSYQCLVDMRFAPLLSCASDRTTWCAAGPGTIRGLNRIYGRKVDAKLSQRQAMRDCLELWPIIRRETGVKLDLSDVPNIMCETDKFCRTLNGEGRPKVKYVPSGMRP